MVNITTNSKGFIFDTTGMPDSGISFAQKQFYPYTSVESISLYDDRVVGIDTRGTSFDMTIIPVAYKYPISTVNGVVVTTLLELYNALISAYGV